MSRIANKLIKDDINRINLSEVNPYLLYYFFPELDDKSTDVKVAKAKSLSIFNGIFNALNILKYLEKKREFMLRQLESDCYQLSKIKARLTQNAVPGIGIESPYETGIRLHHIYGFPFVPGSEIKGSVLSYVKDFLGKKEDDPEILEILGSQSKKGSIIFLDAYPLPPFNGKLFKVDIVTPHYQPYYGGKGVYPSDWFSPEPLPFLTIKKGAEFMFYIVSKDLNNLTTATNWLREALQNVGVGAKTMTGFGHFKVVN